MYIVPPCAFSENLCNTHHLFQYWRTKENPDPQKPNQDAFLLPRVVLKADGGIDTIIVAVFDGHGRHGDLAANIARDYLNDLCELNIGLFRNWNARKWSQQIPKIFEEMHNRIRRAFLRLLDPIPSVTEEGVLLDERGNFISGGTTATLFVLKGNEDGSFSWVCANVGDSPASLITMPNYGNPGSVRQITADHSPLDQAEWLRMHSAPYKNHPKGPLNSFYENPVLPCFTDEGVLIAYDGAKFKIKNFKKERSVYVRDAINPRDCKISLAFTRALGDFQAHPCGVTYVPSVAEGNIPPGVDFRVILYTDGVGDCETEEWGIGNVLHKTPLQRLLIASEGVFTECFHVANKTFGGTRDDMTMVVMAVSSIFPRYAAAGFQASAAIPDAEASIHLAKRSKDGAAAGP